MKDSGSVWFGNIPINWEMKRLKYVFHIQKDIAGEELEGAILVVTNEKTKEFLRFC